MPLPQPEKPRSFLARATPEGLEALKKGNDTVDSLLSAIGTNAPTDPTDDVDAYAGMSNY